MCARTGSEKKNLAPSASGDLGEAERRVPLGGLAEGMRQCFGRSAQDAASGGTDCAHKVGPEGGALPHPQ